MNTEAVKSCPKCHAPIPAEAPQGLCPQCLLASASMATEAGPAERRAVPSREEVAGAFPHLEIIEFLGQGGMGVVFKARQPKLDRFVALKLLAQRPGADPAFEERFLREARVLARLSHPNIVAVHDFGQAGHFFYLLMEFVDGVSLRQVMRRERFTPAQALGLVPRICDALQYAHEEGVLHRDIKPENLLLDKRGRIKIADFGIAKLLGEAKDIALTASGSTIGTPHYMAPEQLEHPHDVDQRADVYSLGVVFYEMLTGELPIGRFAPPSEKAPMDPRVDEVVLRTLEKERERRFQSAGDVKTQVERITANPDKAADAAGAADPRASGPATARTSASNPPTKLSLWSTRAIIAAALVGLSLLEFVLVALQRGGVGPDETIFLLFFMGGPAAVGSVLGWLAVREFRANPGPRRGGRMALLSAVAWPLLLLNLLLLLVVVMFVRNLQWQVFHSGNGFFGGVVIALGVVGLVGADVFVVRRWLRRWKVERALPSVGLRPLLNRFPRWALWTSGLVGIILLLILIKGAEPNHAEEPPPIVAVVVPSPPAGYEVPAGQAAENNNQVYRSSLMVPGGYALTVAAVLCSNQVIIHPATSNAAAALLAPKGQPVQGHLSRRLLGNTSFADGAPLEVSLGLDQGQDHPEKSFHVVPPEPLRIDWVGTPPQLWPPQNGHTKFVLLKGVPADSQMSMQPDTEWAVGIEMRLDPIPESLLDALSVPVVRLGTNWNWTETVDGVSASPEATPPKAPESADTEPRAKPRPDQ